VRDRGDAIEVCVVVEDGEIARLSSSRDEQVGKLASSLMLHGEQTLDLTRTAYMIGRGFDQL
jgi:hypothetical protein